MHALDGIIGMACGETARFSEPYDSLMNLNRPPNWLYRSVRSMSIAENWNALAQFFLSTDARWLFLTNDDHVYPPDTLLKLLARDVDVITALYLERQWPFVPVLADTVSAAGQWRPRCLRDGERGLARVAACGDGALLLKRRVIEKIPAPRWELGVAKRDACDHDTAFSAKVRAAGFTIWCDLTVHVGHVAVMPVFPFQDHAGAWSTALFAGPEKVITISAARSPLDVVAT